MSFYLVIVKVFGLVDQQIITMKAATLGQFDRNLSAYIGFFNGNTSLKKHPSIFYHLIAGWIIYQLTLGKGRVLTGQVTGLLQGWQRDKQPHTYRQFRMTN